MDPEQTVKEIERLYIASQRDPDTPEHGYALDAACEDLAEWVHRGGFLPTTWTNEAALSYWRCRRVAYSHGQRNARDEYHARFYPGF